MAPCESGLSTLMWKDRRNCSNKRRLSEAAGRKESTKRTYAGMILNAGRWNPQAKHLQSRRRRRHQQKLRICQLECSKRCLISPWFNSHDSHLESLSTCSASRYSKVLRGNPPRLHLSCMFMEWSANTATSYRSLDA